jgi:hypothetical protein
MCGEEANDAAGTGQTPGLGLQGWEGATQVGRDAMTSGWAGTRLFLATQTGGSKGRAVKSNLSRWAAGAMLCLRAVHVDRGDGSVRSEEHVLHAVE